MSVINKKSFIKKHNIHIKRINRSKKEKESFKPKQ